MAEEKERGRQNGIQQKLEITNFGVVMITAKGSG